VFYHALLSNRWVCSILLVAALAGNSKTSTSNGLSPKLKAALLSAVAMLAPMKAMMTLMAMG
jgi:hypothetical protein